MIELPSLVVWFLIFASGSTPVVIGRFPTAAECEKTAYEIAVKSDKMRNQVEQMRGFCVSAKVSIR